LTNSQLKEASPTTVKQALNVNSLIDILYGEIEGTYEDGPSVLGGIIWFVSNSNALALAHTLDVPRTCAKGMTNRAVPMGGALVRWHVYEAMTQGPEAAVELAHGYTYSGHPLACAAALASLDDHMR
jgi:hypothetical protein